LDQPDGREQAAERKHSTFLQCAGGGWLQQVTSIPIIPISSSSGHAQILFMRYLRTKVLDQGRAFRTLKYPAFMSQC
jgi:hypothetical protein